MVNYWNYVKWVWRGCAGAFVVPQKILWRPFRLFKVSNWSTRIRCENCLRLRMKTPGRCGWRYSSVFIVNCAHISNFVLIVEFEEANVCWVHIEKKNTFEDKIGHVMRCVAVFSVWTKFINKWHLNLYHHNSTGESLRNFCEGVYFRHWFWPKRLSSHSNVHLVYIYLFTDFACWKTN